MNTRADAFRYGLLVGLKEAGLTEKVAYDILDQLEAVKYDIRGFEKTAGRARGAWEAIKGFGKGLTGWGAKPIKQQLRQNRVKVRDADQLAKGMGFQIPAEQRAASLGRGVPAGFQSGAKVNKWLGKHPVVAGGVGAAGLLAGNRVVGGASAAASDLADLHERSQQLEQFLQATQDPAYKLQEMRQMMQLMRGGGGGGLPPWYNPRAIYGS